MCRRRILQNEGTRCRQTSSSKILLKIPQVNSTLYTTYTFCNLRIIYVTACALFYLLPRSYVLYIITIIICLYIFIIVGIWVSNDIQMPNRCYFETSWDTFSKNLVPLKNSQQLAINFRVGCLGNVKKNYNAKLYSTVSFFFFFCILDNISWKISSFIKFSTIRKTHLKVSIKGVKTSTLKIDRRAKATHLPALFAQTDQDGGQSGKKGR